MRNIRKNSGVTLIALVITIIVLLILAGVALNTIRRGNIIENANTAVDRYNRSAGDDQNLIDEIDELLSQYTGTSSGPGPVVATSGATITYNANGGTGNIDDGFVAPIGNGFIEWNTQPDGNGTGYAPGDEVSTNTTLYAIWGGTYKLGQEVTINGESFYVIKDEGTSATKVTLLAKYNLDKDPDTTTGKYYQNPNAEESYTACALSSTNYWYSDWVEGTRINLNTYTTDAVATAKNQTEGNNVIMRARYYATNTINSSAIGRLLTYEEADALKDRYWYEIYGEANRQYEMASTVYSYLNFWLADVSDSYSSATLVVAYEYLTEGDYICFEFSCGCRPVIEISKDLIN